MHVSLYQKLLSEVWAVLVTKPIFEINKQDFEIKSTAKIILKIIAVCVTDLIQKDFCIGTTKVNKLRQQENAEKSL